MKIAYGIVLATIVLIILISCETQQKKEERLAKKYCGSCHAFPEPGLLDKKTWENGVFPEMASRMGVNLSVMFNMSEVDQKEFIKTVPGQPMVTEEEWKAIQNYYLKNAPDSLVVLTQTISNVVEQFDVETFRLPVDAFALTTLVKMDTINDKIYVGNRYGKLYQLNTKFILEDSFQLNSPASQIVIHKNENPMLLLMGIMDPNDQNKGELIRLKLSDRTSSKIIDSIKRPVFFEEIDLNQDNRKDYVVCAFGNYMGALLVYEDLGDGKYQKHLLQNIPGARKVIVKDFDKNGLMDVIALMAQGDEKIILFQNQGNFNFKITTLLRFPPVYGSSYFDIADFNGDGKFDILYTNGDNADYSMILKPYHGVHIFLNDGNNEFHESWFHPMHGASQAEISDFDADGDLDIAAISFFPDFKKHPEQSFLYFENTGKDFLPQITPLAVSGRWLTMDVNDIDRDGDKDILLGALNFFNSGITRHQFERWSKEKTSVLILKNKLK